MFFFSGEKTDECPECENDHIDLQALTWAKVMNPAVPSITTCKLVSLT